uniref:bacillithiol biosynthesis cysteine-adding enzyme BshC n=1 Tax=Flavobacterium sp. TaxID=239 RepID=UPI002FDDB29B
MPNDCISYQKSGYFSKLIIDYLAEKNELKPLYNHFPTLANFKFQLAEKQANYNSDNRKVLVKALEEQYRNYDLSAATQFNIQKLSESKTFTITTGHQLNLFTGPLYFLYKIVSVINLCKTLQATYPEYHFVPVYWMATEDHDFEEINYFHFKNVKIKWDKNSTGPVGRLATSGLEEVYEVFAKDLGVGHYADELRKLFEESYLKHSNLAEATRYLANALFGDTGLVILDGDDPKLKQLFAPFIEQELVAQTSFQKVSETNNNYLSTYDIQVNPRAINLFYIEDTIRERIIFDDNRYFVNQTDLSFSPEELRQLLASHPERFSPNVILRPLYQEVILPNLCYIGGGGEIAYWLQLKSNFEAFSITFPMLLLRNSVLLATEKQVQKADKLGLRWADLFSDQQTLFDQKTKEYSLFNLDFTAQKAHLQKQFDALRLMAEQTDKSFAGAVKAQEVKQIKGLENLEKRLLKAERKVYAEKLERIIQLQNELFPNQSLQERRNNFSEFYLESGKTLMKKLYQNLDPLSPNFTIITL